MSIVAEVILWGRRIGAVSLAEGDDTAAFQYDPVFVGSGIQPSPIAMPLSDRIYSFPELPRISFHGLPGLLADSLPDKFGNALINAWLASEGRSPESFNVIERLCYIGDRGMGALEFRPALGPRSRVAHALDVSALTQLASEVLAQRHTFNTSFEDDQALKDILRVGTSAGGARAKAVIAWNPETNEVRSGQVDVPEGFEHWLLKFDGVSANRDKELNDPEGYGAIEYAYHLMARSAGITMSDCHILEENGRRHFMTRRFDRDRAGRKIHMQSLGGLAHFDFNAAGAYSYEQAMDIAQRLDLGMDAVEELFRRMTFNIVARNQDDHVKNIAFLMDRAGKWYLAPAFDLTYSYNPDGAWTSTHQMTLNNKRDHFSLEDFQSCARTAGMKRGRAESILEEVTLAVTEWPQFAREAKVGDTQIEAIQRTHRLEVLK